MVQLDAKFWERARRARDRLAQQFLDHPDVRLIDIGRDPAAPESDNGLKRPVLRIHVRQPLSREKLGLPAELDGISICVLVADYRLE